MSPKPQYWILNEQQFIQIKSELDILQQSVYAQLEPLGFTKPKIHMGWLGFTIEKKESGQMTLIGFSLMKEQPIVFVLVARKWQTANPSQTYIDLYHKSFASMKEIINNPDEELAVLIEKLENVL